MSMESGRERTTGDGAPSFVPRDLTLAIFAGSSGKPGAGGQNKNFFLLDGRPLVQRQLDLARELDFKRVILVTDEKRVGELELPPRTTVLPSQPRQAGNFRLVKSEVTFADDERCLVLFGDTPLISSGTVSDFLNRAAAVPVDFHHGLVPQVFVEPFLDYFPRPLKGRQPFHVREFLARLGCLSLLRVNAFDPEATRAAVSTVMQGRKQDPDGGVVAHAMARFRVLWGGLRFLGPKGLWLGTAATLAHWVHERGFPHGARLFRTQVTLGALDKVCTRLLGCESRFLVCPYGGASLDVDTEVDLEVHGRHLTQLQDLHSLQGRLASQLVEPGFVLDEEHLRSLERFDPTAAGELRRHPELYQEQQRILHAAGASAAASAAA
ncbi:MAG: NTP transferase domain-containing protein [Acidobacteriota bacterium]